MLLRDQELSTREENKILKPWIGHYAIADDLSHVEKELKSEVDKSCGKSECKLLETNWKHSCGEQRSG